MSNCSSNKLDPELFEDPRIEEGQQCDPGDLYPTCSDTINICLCSPEIDDPPDPNVATCVNDIIKRPWPPPPPANPGCNPLSVFVSSRQDTSVPATQNIRLEGGVSYVGNDPCLPELNLELLVNPDFRAGGGAPSARGWGINEYGHVGSWSSAAICPDACCGYDNPQQYLAEVPGAESFIPDNDVGCGSQFNSCEYKYTWAKKVARWGLIGPVLCEVIDYEPSETTQVQYTDNDGNPVTTVVTISWSYEIALIPAVRSGDTSITGSGTSCGGIPFIPNLMNNANNEIKGMLKDKFDAWNIKENTNRLTSTPAGLKMTPGLDLTSLKKAGFEAQPIMKGTVVLAYGWVPWSSLSPNSGPSKCDCEIIWFFDVPNAVTGECTTPEGLTLAFSMLPSRKITSAGMFFGISDNENRV